MKAALFVSLLPLGPPLCQVVSFWDNMFEKRRGNELSACSLRFRSFCSAASRSRNSRCRASKLAADSGVMSASAGALNRDGALEVRE